VPPTVHSTMGDPGITLAQLAGLPAAGAALTLRNWLQAAGYPAPDQSALDEFLRQLEAAAVDANPRLECSVYTLQRYRDAVYLLPDPHEPRCNDPFTLAPGEVYDVPGVGTISLEPVTGKGVLLAPAEQLELAWRIGGERCRPHGRVGSNSLKKLLQDRDIPPWWRDRVPLLYLGDELLAVGDLWLCESSRWRASAAPGERLWAVCWQRNTGEARD
jgi:tRNA(Ile)-lysidine synthase